MKLNGRLRLIAESIPKCRILSDIGTDHAYIPIYALTHGVCEKAIAADVRSGPLLAAQKNIKRYDLENLIEARLGDGFGPIDETECDVAVIAGMGGALIRNILAGYPEKAKRCSKLLLQPNNAAEALRGWLYENGFGITSEKLVKDGRKLYCLIEAEWTGSCKKRDFFDCYIGNKLLVSNAPLLESYLKKKLAELNTIIEGRTKSDPDKERRKEYDSYIDTQVCIDIRDKLLVLLEKKWPGPGGNQAQDVERRK